jgi:hypothetical protein
LERSRFRETALRLLRRILVVLVITLLVGVVSVQWIAPVALSYYGARKAPAVARVVPTELKNHSISQAPGLRLSYIGYDFEVLWNDLDETQTKQYPKDNPNRVVLVFRSGLRLIVTALPAREWVNGLPAELKTSAQELEGTFGREALQSDYNFVKTVYEFTPDTMHHWNVSSKAFARDATLLILKSLAPLKCAETGIFKVQSETFKGFQQGNAETRGGGVAVNLYSDEGSVELIFAENNYPNPAGVTQPEINRIVQSLHKIIQWRGFHFTNFANMRSASTEMNSASPLASTSPF